MTFPPNTTIEVRLCDARDWRQATVTGPCTRVSGMTRVRINGWEYNVRADQMREYVAPAPVVPAPVPPCGDCGAPSTLDGKTMSCCDACGEARGWDF